MLGFYRPAWRRAGSSSEQVKVRHLNRRGPNPTSIRNRDVLHRARTGTEIEVEV
jgi:hypothetical protein